MTIHLEPSFNERAKIVWQPNPDIEVNTIVKKPSQLNVVQRPMEPL
jgi:hypothetical protein